MGKIKYIFIFLLFLTGIPVFSQIPDGYYDDADGLSGTALKEALHNIIKGHHKITYDEVKEALKITDRDTVDADKVICFYTGWTYEADSFGGDYNDWNREHVWSRSHGGFDYNSVYGTDLHQLRPTDASVNSAKGNRDFDWGTEEYLDNGGTIPTGCYKANYVWEPRNAVKGDVARIIFYMATRYEGDDNELDLEVIDQINTAGDSNLPFYGKLSTLLIWHHNDPVDDFERNRNDIIYQQYQHNRNPFIDHPEYIDSIWGNTLSAEPSNHVQNFVVTQTTATSISLSWQPNDGSVAAHGFIIKANTTGTFTAPSDGTEIANDTDLSDGEGAVNLSHNITSYEWTNLSPHTTYYFAIYPFTNTGNEIDYKTDGTIPTTHGTTGSGSILLIISEVADPADIYQARFVEITNIGTLTVDFEKSVWYLCRQANASSWGDIQLHGIIQPDSSITIAYNQSYFQNAYGISPSMTSGYISGNGNDGYFLYQGGDHTTGTLIDAYGVKNTDGENEPWEYEDSRAYRLYSVTAPDSIWNQKEWIIEQASTAQMTPDWSHRTLYWTGDVSGEITNPNNWNNTSGKVSLFAPDASCKMIIGTNGDHIPTISSNLKVSVLEITNGAQVQINNNALLQIID